jgi:hypothetical protein
MNLLQDVLEQSFEDIPQRALAEVIAEKLNVQSIKLSKRRLAGLAKQAFDEKTGTLAFAHGWWPRKRTITLEFNEDDLKNMDVRLDRALEKLPAMVEEIVEKTAAGLLENLKQRWRKESRRQRRYQAGFQKRLHERWGLGLDRLDMLITIARESGAELNTTLRAAGGGERPQTFDVLVKLHARACQVANEILSLLNNGFADGAMARWRTMQEIAAVGYVIGRHGEALAERYVSHEVIEARRAARQYRRYQERLGQEPISDAELTEIDAMYDAAVAKYGAAFATPYGWAAEHLGKPTPTMADIQEAAQIDHLTPYYRMASHNVHANPKGVFFKLGLLDESEILLAGPSNAGLADPGHACALSLNQITSVLLRLNETFDHVIVMKIMYALADEVGDALIAAHQKLVEDERARQRGFGQV